MREQSPQTCGKNNSFTAPSHTYNQPLPSNNPSKSFVAAVPKGISDEQNFAMICTQTYLQCSPQRPLVLLSCLIDLSGTMRRTDMYNCLAPITSIT